MKKPDDNRACYFCGEGGIRTLDTLASIQTFQACSFDHSDTSPLYDIVLLQINYPSIDL